MPINVSDENVSAEQRAFLERARQFGGERFVPRVVEYVEELVASDAVTSGDEHVDPGWIALLEQYDSNPRIAQSSWRRRIERIRRGLDEHFNADSLIESIEIETQQIAFLLGAGASKPHPSNIPTVKELLPELLARARRLDREQVTQLANFCRDQHIDNIEDLLTAVQIADFCSRKPSILSLVDFQLFGSERSLNERRRLQRPTRTDVSSVAHLQDTLQVLFALLSNLMLPASPNAGHRAMVDYLHNFPDTPIVTTNYDCCVDRALIDKAIRFSYTIEFANPDIVENPSYSGVPLIKLHGSLNWFYCETCQDVRMIDIKETVERYKDGRGDYPIISVCNKCGGQRKVLLVPPHAMKFDAEPPLQPLINEAANWFEKATLIIVVGFSFADADSYITRMLIKAMQASERRKLIIIDPDSQVIEKVRHKFGVQIPNFDSSSRILHLQGDCSILLPRLLRREPEPVDDNTLGDLSDDIIEETAAVPAG